MLFMRELKTHFASLNDVAVVLKLIFSTQLDFFCRMANLLFFSSIRLLNLPFIFKFLYLSFSVSSMCEYFANLCATKFQFHPQLSIPKGNEPFSYTTKTGDKKHHKYKFFLAFSSHHLAYGSSTEQRRTHDKAGKKLRMIESKPIRTNKEDEQHKKIQIHSDFLRFVLILLISINLIAWNLNNNSALLPWQLLSERPEPPKTNPDNLLNVLFFGWKKKSNNNPIANVLLVVLVF